MTERYLVTGVQLGMFFAFDDKKQREELMDEIVENQFLGNSKKKIEDDVKSISTFFSGYYDDSESYKK